MSTITKAVLTLFSLLSHWWLEVVCTQVMLEAVEVCLFTYKALKEWGTWLAQKSM